MWMNRGRERLETKQIMSVFQQLKPHYRFDGALGVLCVEWPVLPIPYRLPLQGLQSYTY